jgi:hypothetical protein
MAVTSIHAGSSWTDVGTCDVTAKPSSGWNLEQCVLADDGVTPHTSER